MIKKTQQIGPLSVWTEENSKAKPSTTVYFNYQPIVIFNPNKINERRLAAVQLVELGYCNQKTAGKICGFHRNTVFKLLRTKRLLGLEALLKDDRGPKTPWKYVGKIRKTIKKLLRQHPDWIDQQIADEAAKLLETAISRSAVARIRTEKQDLKQQKFKKHDLKQLAQIADSLDLKLHDEKQLTFNFEADGQFKKAVETFEKQPTPEPVSDNDTQLLDNLKQGQRSIFGGMLFHHLFLNQVEFFSAFDHLPSASNAYAHYEVMQAIMFGLNIGLPSIEAHKLVNSYDLGLLSGRTRSPDESTIRRRLNQMAQYQPSEDLIDYFANLFLTLGFIDPEVFFIDGHFLPYYGLKAISKGYFTVRRLAIKGNEIYVVSDLNGLPLFSITEGCDIDFRPIIQRAAEKLIALGIQRPLLVFDRGGYGVHFFSRLIQRADFITWAKYFKKQELQDLQYTSCIKFNDKKYLVAEKKKRITESAATAQKDGRGETTSLQVRMVVFKDINDGTPVPIYTSDEKRPAGDIAYYMLCRWGESENFFKEIMSLYNFNYHPGYDIKELKEQPLVDNPEVKTIKKTIKAIKQKTGQLVFEKLQTEDKLNHRKDIRLEKRLIKLQNQIDEYNQDQINFTEKLAKLPEKISIMDLLQGQPMNRADLEKKKLYDLLQMIAFHSREYLIQLFRSCYKDPRDVKQVLTKITKLPGYVKLYGKTLVVLLDWIQDKKHREAANKFCHLVNGLAPKLKGRMEFNLFFRISSVPQGGK
jgi:transposase/predicted transcriptional regulator with HTH domain